MGPFMVDCFICECAFQHGPHKYEGRGIGEWGIVVCDRCYNGNQGGLVPHRQPKLMSHLKAKSIDPARNKRGWIDWPE